MTLQQIVAGSGLLLDIAGAWVLTYSLIVTEKEARDLSAAYWAAEDGEETELTPPERDRLEQGKRAKIGLFLLVSGFVLQGIALFLKP